MSRGKNGRAELAPSLFPFLAVLLCTVGALVLILVLVVSQSQASVKAASDTHAERTAELRTQVELVRDSFKDAREKIQLEIEKKRMSLQGLEKQTSDLLKELEDLQKTGELIEKKLTDTETTETLEQELTDLQKELEEAAEKLKTKLDKPTGDKPVFAIVPYTGNNGTHRRPIYLECREDGIVIQPEGVVIGLSDLKPPYGPGNPLDAALRTIRTHYAPKDGALHTSAYPLLVVRSSGIRTYALARMAMAGWDDQFGYELIDDEMELDFPAGEPGLSKDIEESLVAARNRQAALVMAMPGRYRRAMAELDDDHFSFDDGAPADGQWGAGGDGVGGQTGSGNDARSAEGLPGAGGQSGLGGQPGSGLDETGTGAGGLALSQPDAGGFGMPAAGGRAGFAFDPDAARGASSPGDYPGGSNPSGNRSGGGSGMQGFATGGKSPADANFGNSGQSPGGGLSTADGQAAATGSGTGSFAEGAFSGNRFTAADSSGTGGGSGATLGEAGGQMAGAGQGATADQSNTREGNFRDAMNAARAKQQGSGDSQSSQPAAGGTDGGTGGSQMETPRSEGFGSMSGNLSEAGIQKQVGAASSLSGRKQEHAEAVAKRKGRNWAWSAGPPRDTAVVRTIRIACYEDRWVVLAEPAAGEKAQTVMLDVALQTSAEELAKVIAGRVDRWGFALASGYWKPVLVVEVAPGGEARFEQLKRLLDGSGLEVQAAGGSGQAK